MTLNEFVESENEEQGLFEKLLSCPKEERDSVIAQIEAFRYVKAMIKKILHEQEK